VGVQGEPGMWHYTAARWREAWMVWRAAPVLYSAHTLVSWSPHRVIDAARGDGFVATTLLAVGMAAAHGAEDACGVPPTDGVTHA